MVDASLSLDWSQAPTKYAYWYGATRTRFSAQVGHASGSQGFAWVIFHKDFRGAVWGGEAATVEEAKAAAQEWLALHAKPLTDAACLA